MRWPTVSRRTLLIGGGAGVGLVVAFLAWPRREGSPLRPGPRETVFGPFLRIAIDGRVTLAVPQVETGQGIWTGLAQIAADELGAAWESMAVEPAPHGCGLCQPADCPGAWGDTRITAGSSSIRAFEQPLREAAAIARAMLCAAAAERWGVSAAECDTDGGFVVHEGKRLASARCRPMRPAFDRPDNPALRPAKAGSWPANRCRDSICPPSPTAACASRPTCACRGCSSPRSGWRRRAAG